MCRPVAILEWGSLVLKKVSSGGIVFEGSGTVLGQGHCWVGLGAELSFSCFGQELE